MTKQEIIENFDVNGPAGNYHMYGLPFGLDDAEVVVFAVPWEVTVSYAAGTAAGPDAIREASWQVDLYDPAAPDAWKMGIFMKGPSEKWHKKSNKLRKKAERYIDAFVAGEATLMVEDLKHLNDGCRKMVDWVYKETQALLDKGKLVVLLGGDHSTPLGFIKALGEVNSSFGILQIDAHADLREAFEGFTYSHASIMYNALELPHVSKLVQVGIRDYCQEELDYINNNADRVKTFFDRDLKQAQFAGETWKQQVDKIIAELPEKVYLSFDIDGLDPKLCPNTGTPVAGGFETDQVLYLIEQVVASGRKLIGLDLNEVAPGHDEWDANVGARLLYRLCNQLGKSNGRL